jgi:soluble lytic murein transglycosylase-like protein
MRSVGAWRERWAALAVLAWAFAAPAAAQEAVLDEGAQLLAWRAQAIAYEHGDGVAKDGERAALLYCEAARLGDAESQFNLGWMYANGRGVKRDDALAAFFLRIAAAQGITQAANLLPQLGQPVETVPECMRDPEPMPLVVSTAPVLRDASLGAPRPIVDLVDKIAPQLRVPPPLVFAIIEAESNFDSRAVSAKNAQGLMQLIPETAARFQVKNAFDPAQNVRGGTAYLRWLLAYFEGDVELVAAAYNAGERTVERYLGVPPYLETRAYVRRIVSAVGPNVARYDASVVEPSALMSRIRERRAAR